MEKLISRKEAAKLLGISIATLDAARNSGLISYVQYVQNGCVYFTDAGLQEYIAKCTHRAKPVEKSATWLMYAARQHTIFSTLAEADIAPIKVELMEPSLESLFLEVIK